MRKVKKAKKKASQVSKPAPVMTAAEFARFMAKVKRDPNGDVEWTVRSGDSARDRMTKKLKSAGVTTVDGLACWIWTASVAGGTTKRPRFQAGGRTVIASRTMLATYLGKAIPADRDVHHGCENEKGLCVRPDHLAHPTPRDHKVIHRKGKEVQTKMVQGLKVTSGPDGYRSYQKAGTKSSKST
jgi:hypothetical protein